MQIQLAAFEQKVEAAQGLRVDADKKLKLLKLDEEEAECETRVISRPTVIKFPKCSNPLISVACGSQHVLALTIEQELYSWGAGKYGALGFGVKEDCYTPKRLDLFDFKGQKLKITQISCGKLHSMCLTSKQNLFTWGEGKLGRLGHGNEADQLAPKELYALSLRKPIQISAGETHSAAITEKANLFTWGNGGYGRLGHGSDSTELEPKLVQHLIDQEMRYVSCGQFHTVAVSSGGHTYSFGQNKYGKLGISILGSQEKDTQSLPEKIAFYKSGMKEPVKDKANIVQVSAGFNHSMALSNTGKLYSWGYNGKGILGRVSEQEDGRHKLPLPVGSGSQIKFQCKVGSDNGIQEYLDLKNIGLLGVQSIGRGVDKKQAIPITQDGNEGAPEFFIKQICCGASNTVGLTNTGDVYVLGDNTYGQHGVEETEKPSLNTKSADPADSRYGQGTVISKIEFPFKTQDKIEYIACGGQHLFAKTSLDEIYGWGKNDEGQLGIGYLTDFVGKPQFLKGLSFKGIKQICCGDNFSAALSIYGDVYVAGSLEGGKLGLGKGSRKGFQLEFKQITDLPEIDFIACGLNHMLAISRYNPDSIQSSNKNLIQTGKTYAWGKNQRGQLGIGNKDNQYSPCVIENAKERLKKVACGSSFSLGLSYTDKLYFWGNFKYFCNSQVRKDREEPTIMTELENNVVFDVACDYKYVVALCDKGKIRQWGKYLLSKAVETAENTPGTYGKIPKQPKDEKKEVRIEQIQAFPSDGKFNISMEQVVTSPNHSCAISAQNKVYVWGHNCMANRLGVDSSKSSNLAKDQPVLLWALQNVIEKQKEAFQLQKQFGGANEQEDDFGDTGQQQRHLDEENMDDDIDRALEETDVNHQDDAGEYEDDASGKQQINTEQHDGGQDEDPVQRQQTQGQASQKQSTKNQAGQKQKNQQANQNNTVAKNVQLTFQTRLINEIREFNEQPLQKKQSSTKAQVNVFDSSIDLSVLEYIGMELQKKEAPPIVQISYLPNITLLDATILLQKVLKREDQQKQDEKSIQVLDEEIVSQTNETLTKICQFNLLQFQNVTVLQKAKNSFILRIADPPFQVDSRVSFDLRAKEMDQPIYREKKMLKKFLLYLHLHPCYIIKLFKAPHLRSDERSSFQEKKQIIRQLFGLLGKTNIQRQNYLLISIYEAMLNHEMPQKLQEVDLLKDCKMISVYIFRRVFKSSQTNIDTICCIVAHIANHIIATYNQTLDAEDDSFDVEGKAGKEGAEKTAPGGNKGGKGGKGEKKKEKTTQGQRATALVEFVRQVAESILQNSVLGDAVQYFGFKKKVQSQLDYLKKQWQEVAHKRSGEQANTAVKNKKKGDSSDLGGLAPEELKAKFPTLRFSRETLLMVQILYNKLKSLENNSFNDDKTQDGNSQQPDQIASQILGLVFGQQLRKIKMSKALYLYPYLQKAKQLQFIEEQISTVHKINISNAIEVLIHFFEGSPAFHPCDEVWCKELNHKLTHYQQTLQNPILQKVLRYGQEIDSILSYKNFENMVIHSLEQEDSRLCVDKSLIGLLLSQYSDAEKWKDLSLQSPAKNDPLINLVMNANVQEIIKMKNTSQKSKEDDDKMTFIVQTRIFVQKKKTKDLEGFISQYVRCQSCNAILPKDLAVQNYDQNIVISTYEPQDKTALYNLYSNILKSVPQINKESLVITKKKEEKQNQDKKEGALHEFITQAGLDSKRNCEYRLNEMITNFSKKLEDEVKTQSNEQYQKAMEKQEEKKLVNKDQPFGSNYQDKVVYELLQQAEQKLNQRAKQKFQIQLIQNQVQLFLWPQIQCRYEQFKKDLIQRNLLLHRNYQYGLANRDFLPLLKDCQSLQRMQKVHDFTSKLSKSQVLSKSLTEDLKKKMRGFLRIDVPALEEGTIGHVQLKELEDLLPKCHVVLIEQETGTSIEFKLVYRDVRRQICGPPTIVQEQVLLKFEVTMAKLKEIRNKVAQDTAKIKQEGGKQTSSKQVKKSEAHQWLVFEENDSLGFDHGKFLALIAQMERQKAAYVLQDSDAPNEKEIPKREKETSNAQIPVQKKGSR